MIELNIFRFLPRPQPSNLKHDQFSTRPFQKCQSNLTLLLHAAVQTIPSFIH